MRRWITLIVGLLVSAVTLYLAFRSTNLAEVGSAFQHARYEYVVMCAVIVVAGMAVRGLRWRVLTGGRLNLADAFWLWNIGFLFNDVLPAKLGEIVKSMLAGRRPGMSFTSALSSVVVERLFDMVTVAALLAIALASNPLPSWATDAGLVISAIAVVGIGVLAFAARNPEPSLKLGVKVLALLPMFTEEKAHDFLAPFVEGLGGVRDLRIFAAGLGLSALAWAISAAATWVLMFAFWPDPPFSVAVLVLAAAGLGVSVPSAPSGIGPFQAAIIGVLTVIHYDLALSQSYAIANHGLVFIVTVVMGLIGLGREGVSFGDMARQAQGGRVEENAADG
jgi:hypothetical protein